jgi:hypothetical protein
MSLLLWHPECLWPRSHREQNVIYIGSKVNTNVTHISGVVTSLSAYSHIAGRCFCLPLWEFRSLQIIYKLLTFSVHSTRFSVGPFNNSSDSTADWGTAPQDGSLRVRSPVGTHSYCPHSVFPGSTQSNRNAYQGISSGLKCGRLVELKTVPSSLCRVSK